MARKRRIRSKRIQLERLERRELLAADLMAFRHNPVEPLDVNGDAFVSAVDALNVVNELNRRGDRPASAQENFLDVNNDQALTPIDALMVVNGVNSRGRGGQDRGRGPGPDGGENQPDGGQQDQPLGPNGGPDGGTDSRRDGGPGDQDPRDRPPRPPADEDPGNDQTPTEFASIDGTGNNLENPELGSTGEALSRWVANEYEDGLGTPAHEDWASAREVSNIVNSVPTDEDGQPLSIENSDGLSDLTWLFGQFLDHDITLTGEGHDESFEIEVPTGDPFFDPFNTGEATISLSRSAYELDGDSVRQQFNEISAFIDGSVIYGSDQERADALRTFEGGLLKTSEGDLLPFNEDGLLNAGGDSSSLFLAGDIRANENSALAAMHTIWVREHNRVATRISSENPELSDEEIYQQARQFVSAELQAITYNEFLPAILGNRALSRYDGYDASVDPSISNVFATAAYRFGHTMLSPELQRLNEDGSIAEEGNLALQDAFFNVSALTENGIDSILRGAAAQTAQEVDPFLVDDVRNFLFGPPGSGGFDLASLNIQRGRDHGLADYNQVREDMGLERVTSFEEISSDPEIQRRLEEAYGDVDSIDAWVGMLAEDHARGSTLGITASTIIAEQFEALRDGDRFYYENVFEGRQLDQLNRTTLADVIERNSNIDFDRGQNVFFAQEIGSDQLANNDNDRRDRQDNRLVAGEAGTATPPIQSPAALQDQALAQMMEEDERRRSV
ncbi:MAG: peroxidase family protein [Planctomycetota bacterium]